jgi:predicted aspartyl protease
MIARWILCGLALLVAATGPAVAETDCRLHLVASVPMNFDDSGRAFVPMTVAHRTLNLMIDTGGLDTMLTAATSEELRLPYSFLGRHTVTVFGGTTIDRVAAAQDVEFGGLKTPEMRVLVMPNRMIAPWLNGTLAPDILRAYDDDFDFANGKFNLFSPDHCRGQVVYWTHEPVAEIPFEFYQTTHIAFPVLLDGKKVTVEMDTGSTRSIFSLEQAERLFDFDQKSPNLKPMEGKEYEGAYRYPFSTLTSGGITVSNPDVLLVPDAKAQMGRGGDHMILGMSVLRQLHLYIAYGERKLYITPATAH